MNLAAPIPYIPDRGDIVWIDCNPQLGREQGGRRPALVLSPAKYNGRVGLLVCFPITSKVKGYTFEYVLPQDLRVQGAVLTDQIKSYDWFARKVDFICRVEDDTVKHCLAKFNTLVT